VFGYDKKSVENFDDDSDLEDLIEIEKMEIQRKEEEKQKPKRH
jgi:hypothetical protein